jgi:hypothetical protein
MKSVIESYDRLSESLAKTNAAFEALRGLLPPAGSMASGPRLKPQAARKRQRLAVRAARRANR